jgi:hypothetical protein
VCVRRRLVHTQPVSLSSRFHLDPFVFAYLYNQTVRVIRFVSPRAPTHLVGFPPQDVVCVFRYPFNHIFLGWFFHETVPPNRLVFISSNSLCLRERCRNFFTFSLT